jgi:membrane-associated phospholipid phosphatase
VFFLAAPGDDAFPVQDETSLGIWAPVVHLARNLALRHNYSPSLHVAFTTICLLIYGRGASLLAKSLLGLWCAGIIASTLLLHQHYLIDVAAGLLLGWLTVRLVYRRMTRWPAAQAAGKPPASADPRPMQVV